MPAVKDKATERLFNLAKEISSLDKSGYKQPKGVLQEEVRIVKKIKLDQKGLKKLRRRATSVGDKVVREAQKQGKKLSNAELEDQIAILQEMEIYIKRPRSFLRELKDLIRKTDTLTEARKLLHEEKPDSELLKRRNSLLKRVWLKLKKVGKLGTLLAGVAALASLVSSKLRAKVIHKVLEVLGTFAIKTAAKLQKPEVLSKFLLLLNKAYSGSSTFALPARSLQQAFLKPL